jgi:hypothetical protein
MVLCGPKGQESIAQGLPWVLIYKPEALNHSTRCRLLMPGGRPLTRRRGTTSGNAEAPSGILIIRLPSQGKPSAKFSWPFGPKNQLYPSKGLENVQTPGPGFALGIPLIRISPEGAT